MTWELRHDFKMAATLDPPDWISLFPQNLTKPHKSTKGKKKKKKKYENDTETQNFPAES